MNLNGVGQFLSGAANTLGNIFQQSNPLTNSTFQNSVAQQLPQNMWSGAPIRNFLSVPSAYAQTAPNNTPTNTSFPVVNPNDTTGIKTINTNSGGSSSGGSNGGSGNSQLDYLRAVRSAGDLNPAQDSALKALEASMNNNAQSAYNAQNQALNTQFDQSAANLSGQLTDLGTQKANSLSELGLAQTDAQNQAQNAKLSAQTNTNNQIDQAGSIANSTQLQNRNVLRALGIGNSSYAADLLSKPINEFGKQRANLQEQLGQRMGQLDDFLNSQAQQHSLAVKSLEDNYSSLVGKIQSDLRFNDRQRNDALTAANAALQDNLGKIQSSMLNYHQQVQSQKQQLQNSLIQMLAYQNPSIAKDYLSQMSLNNPDAFQQQGTNIIGAQPVKKDPLTGLPVSQ